MAAIASDTIYTKTAKGILWSKTVQLSRERGLVFQAVDGRATVADLLSRLGLSAAGLQEALDTLTADGYIKVVGQQIQRSPAGDSDLDFTSGAAASAQDDTIPPPGPGDVQRSTSEPPQPEVDMAERVRELNARVQAERRAREEITRRDMLGRNADGASQRPNESWPSLELNVEPEAAQRTDAAQPTDSPSARRPAPGEQPQPAPDATPGRTGYRENDLPHVDFDPAHELHTPEHVPTALERAMAAMAERAKSGATADASGAPESAAPENRSPPAAAMSTAPAIDEGEPLQERVNVDRAAYDMLAETAEARREAEALQLSRDADEARQRRIQEDARRRARAAHEERRRRALRLLAVVLIGVPVAAIAWLQFMPLNGYIPQVQQALSESLDQPVTFSTLRYVLLPTPRLVLENVQIGKTQAVRADRVQARVLPFALWARESKYDRVDAFDVQIGGTALGAIPQWTGRGAGGAVRVQRLRLVRAKLNVPGADLGVFDGELTFGENGTVQQAVFTNANARLELTPRAEGVRVALDATGWRVPYGPPLEFGRLVLNGLIDPSQVAAAEFTGRAAGGALDGALTARWAGPISVQGEFNLQQARLQDLAAGFVREFPVRGVLKASGRFSMQAAEWAALAAVPHVEATFTVVRGELTNIDLVRAIQSPSSNALRGGRTPFDELSGVVGVTGGQHSYRQLQLRSGPLNATGAVTVTAAGHLNGRVTAELGSRSGVVGRSALTIGGTARDPQLQR